MTRPGQLWILSHKPASAPQQPPIPTSVTVIDWWHSELQCTPTSWRGQKNGTNATSFGTNVVGVDGTNFGGRVAAQTFLSSGSRWDGVFAAGSIPAGSKVFDYVVGRPRLSQTDVVWALMDAAPGNNAYNRLQSDGQNPAKWQLQTLFGYLNTGRVIDTLPHRFWAYFDGTNAYLQIDGTLYQLASTAITANETNRIYFSGSGGNGHQCDVSFVFRMVTIGKPTAAEISALDAWTLGYWNVNAATP